MKGDRLPPILLRGLSSAEAARRRAEEGPNRLPAGKRAGPVDLVLEVLREPMFLLLCAASGIYLLIGDVTEALILAASIVVVIDTALPSPSTITTCDVDGNSAAASRPKATSPARAA